MKLFTFAYFLLLASNSWAVSTETRVVRAYLHTKPGDPYNFQAETKHSSEELMPMTREAALELESLQYGKRYECQIESHKSRSTDTKNTILLVYSAAGCREI